MKHHLREMIHAREAFQIQNSVAFDSMQLLGLHTHLPLELEYPANKVVAESRNALPWLQKSLLMPQKTAR